MNANEVIAALAARSLARAVHAERSGEHESEQQRRGADRHPCRGGAAAARKLLPALARLRTVLGERAAEFAEVVKTGRTHLMDAMPITLAQEFGGWQAQIDAAAARLTRSPRVCTGLAQGGTAVGTGINARPQFGAEFARCLAAGTGLEFRPSENYFEALSSQDTAVELSGQLKVLGVSLDEDFQ